MVDRKIDAHDNLRQYCRMLGHKVTFEYCRKMNTNLPCRNILDCWKQYFTVEKFVQEHFSKDEIAFFLQPPKPKLTQIYDLMMKAKKKDRKK